MNGSLERHQQVLGDLELRLRNMYPDQFIYTNVEYGTPKRIVGETDLIRYISPYKVVIYEVKTGHEHFRKAKQQYNRFKRYHPNLDIRGVYVHPDKGVKRMH